MTTIVKIEDIAKARVEFAKQKELTAIYLQNAQETHAYQQYLVELEAEKELKSQLDELEKTLKANAKTEWETMELEDKDHFPGAKMTIKKTLVIDHPAGIAHALENSNASILKLNEAGQRRGVLSAMVSPEREGLLELDEVEIKRLSGKKSTRPNFVSYKYTPSLKIDGDLSEFVPIKKEGVCVDCGSELQEINNCCSNMECDNYFPF